MSGRLRIAVLAGLLLGLDGVPIDAATRTVLGQRFVVKNPGADQSRRKIVVVARDVGASAIVGDPVADGAMLTVVANGGTPSSQMASLAASGWTRTRTG